MLLRRPLLATVLLVLLAPAGLPALPGLARLPGGLDGAAAPRSLLDDPAFTAALDRGLRHLYDLDFDAAETIFTGLAAAHPGHPVGPLLEALPTWWQILLDEDDRSHDGAFLAAMDEVERRAEARLAADADDPDGLFFKAAALAFRGRVRSLGGAWIPAAWDGRRAMKLVRRLAELQPDNPDLAFAFGLYDYFADVIPDRYPIFKPLVPFFPRGERRRGLAELERAADHGRFARTEAAWYLAQIHLSFEDDPAASLPYLARLRLAYPDNALFHSFERRVELRLGECGQASATSREILARHARGAVGYGDLFAAKANYALARCAMEAHRWGEALAPLAELERLTAGAPGAASYYVLGHLRRGMVLDALGRRGEAVSEYRTVLRLPDAAGAHKAARSYLKRPFLR